MFEPEYEPLPDPFHPPKLFPGFGVAWIVTAAPALYHVLDGETVPPDRAFMVKRYCVVKLAVNALSPFARTIWLYGPAPFQPRKK